jgi:hypothetical protein
MGAREYDPRLGRWLSADTIVPDATNPQSLNRFSYVLGNPLKYTDPSGHQEQSFDEWYAQTTQQIDDYDDEAAKSIDWEFLYRLGITFEIDGRMWRMAQIQTVYQGVGDMVNWLGGEDVFRSEIGPAVFRRKAGIPDHKPYATFEDFDSCEIWVWDLEEPSTLQPDHVFHELVHQWDYNYNYLLSADFEFHTGGYTDPRNHMYYPGEDRESLWKFYGYSSLTTRGEDLAYSMTAAYYNRHAHDMRDTLGPRRVAYVHALARDPRAVWHSFARRVVR